MRRLVTAHAGSGHLPLISAPTERLIGLVWRAALHISCQLRETLAMT